MLTATTSSAFSRGQQKWVNYSKCVPNWKRVVVGDAFKVSSGGINHYRDLFLAWPFLLFSIVVISHLFSPDSVYRHYALKSALCATAAILLAKERLILLSAALGYVTIRLAVTLIFIHDWRVLLGAILCGGVLFAIVRSGALSNWKPSYASEKSTYILDLVVGVSGLCLAIAVAMWLKP
jgi:hypothetical protein